MLPRHWSDQSASPMSCAQIDPLHSPPCRTWVVIAYPNVFLAGDTLFPSRSGAVGLEGFDKHLIENEKLKGNKIEGLDLLPEGSTWLLAEFGGETREESVEKAKTAMRRIREEDRDQIGIRLLADPEDYEKVVKIRESGVGASRIPGKEDAWPSWEDAAIAPEAIGAYLRDFYQLMDKHHYVCTLFGHFGGGCIHTRITFNTKTTEGVKNFRQFMTEAAHLVCGMRFSLRRTWGWTATCRNASHHVRFRSHPSVSRIQIRMGPAMAHESGQGDRSSARSIFTSHPTTSPSLLTTSNFPRITEACRKPRSAASALGNAAAWLAEPCAPAFLRRARKCTVPAAARVCFSRCCAAK